jgi:hypothetical protein
MDTVYTDFIAGRTISGQGETQTHSLSHRSAFFDGSALARQDQTLERESYGEESSEATTFEKASKHATSIT